MTAAQAIETSARTGNICHSTDADIMPDLQAECEDSAENGAQVEYWGTTETGAEWRVHVSPNR